jgi:serine phosphatase RsbU (regulator of sigma subunit)/PAS domain-containing protein
VVEALLVVGDVASDETFTAAYVLAPLALALVDRARPVAVVGAIAVALAVVSGAWNEHWWTWGHALRCGIVTVGAVLAVLSAQARTALYRSQSAAVAARGRAEAAGRRLDAILGSLAEAVTVHDERGKTIYANEAAARLLGAESVDEVLRAEPGDLASGFVITTESGGPVQTGDFPGRKAVLGQAAEPILTRTVRRDTGESYWLLTKASVVKDEHGHPLAVNVIEDVTEAKEAELRQRFLASATQVLASSLDYDETLERVAWLTVPEFADWCGVDLLEGGAAERVALAHTDPHKLELARALGQEYPSDLTSETGYGAVVRTGKAELYPAITDEMIVAAARDDRHLMLVREIGMRSAMVVPMKAGGTTIGLLTFAQADSERSFDEDDLAFAEDIAARAATAVENARLYSRLAQTAETLQASLLPERLAQPPGWRVAASYIAGETGTDVGGDFYDVFPVEDGWMVVLGDVTGKGVKAAALTALARHTAKTSARFDPRPAEVMSRVNDVLREQPKLSIVTVVCARLRAVGDGAEVAVVSAGHPLPLRVAPGAEAEEIGHFDIVLGAMDEGEWEESVTTLRPGETLLFYTDGVTELPGETDRFGEQRLREVAGAGPPGAAELVARIERALEAFQAGDLSDDRAMLAIEWVGAAQPAVAR